MLYKNKIKVQNILKSAVALMLMLTLSLSTALSPLAKAEEAGYTWKTLTSAPGSRAGEIYISPDGSKLFSLESDTAHNTNFWMSADDGATWRKIWSKQAQDVRPSFSADGSKIVLEYGQHYFSISTDGGQSWVERVDPVHSTVLISPDGSFLVSCSGSGGATGYTTNISTDDGQTWTQKGTVTTVMSCPRYVSNNGSMIIQNYGDLARSTDYGQTWTETPDVLNDNVIASFSNNGNNIFDGDKISLDGGNHWTPSNAPIPAGYTVYQTGISDDGKKLFVTTRSATGAATSRITRLLTSVDGGRTWHSENGNSDYDMMAMSSDGSKLFYMYDSIYRVGTLPTPQPVTPGAGAGGVATPSASTSATPGQKPGKASGRLAETGASTWMVGGLAVVAVAAGALLLRKRL